MINTGTQLRKLREDLGISQARFAEISGLPQHQISAFELEKATLPNDILQEINSLFPSLSNYSEVINRKKRYKKHVYKEKPVNIERAKKHAKSQGNEGYLADLKALESIGEPKLNAVSFFSGIGGFSLGFKSAGYSTRGFVEIDDGLADIYQKNFPAAHRLGSDVSKVTTKTLTDFKQKFGHIDVVIGGPPCQGFSLSGKRDIDDPRNYLFEDYLRAIDILSPKIAIVENVRLLTSMKSKDGGFVKDAIIKGLSAHGYKTKLIEMNAKNFGVPQHRDRVFFIAVRDDIQVETFFPEMSFGKEVPVRTFADACSDLPFLESGQTSDDPFHKAVKHPEHVLEWLWDVDEGKSAHDNECPEMRPPSGYNTTYKRQVWDQPGATVQTTFGMISGCRNVHPIATRSLTIREACRLQSFPDNFKFTGTLGTIRTGIGNAVPPLLARAIALHINSILADFVEVPRP